ISVLSARTSASTVSKDWRSRSTPFTSIARSTAARLALTKSSPSIAAHLRESVLQGKLVEVQPPVASAEVQQRVEARVEARLHHLADQNVVVAAVIGGEPFTLEHAERILENRRAGLAARP